MRQNNIVGAAYDLKASLDLAAAFLRAGLTTEVFNGGVYRSCSDTQAAVYNMESFFMQPEEEYMLLKKLFRSVPEGTVCFLKSDSSLRGNLGGELAALRDARDIEMLLFVAAFPKARKFTCNGIQYQTNVETGTRTVLADALSLIRGFHGTKATCGPMGEMRDRECGVYVADCASQDEFGGIAEALAAENLKALAGTGALAERLGAICHLETRPFTASDNAAIRVDGITGVLNLPSLEWKKEE